MVNRGTTDPGCSLRAALSRATLADETGAVEAALAAARLAPGPAGRAEAEARRLVAGLRAARSARGSLDAFVQEFDLSNREGVALMCLAEALLRIPDAETANRLIRDKIAGVDWMGHLGHADDPFVNASTWALMLTGRVIRLDHGDDSGPAARVERLIARLGEPVIRQAMIQAMRILGGQFVLGRTMAEALERAAGLERQGYRLSYDMLGEAARTRADADRHFARYVAAIEALAAARQGRELLAAPGLSVKLSALHPRFESGQRERVMRELAPRLRNLAVRAMQAGIGLTVDVEEADRLELTLDLMAAVLPDPALADWAGFGLAVQAYQKRALPVLEWLDDLAGRHGRRLMVRLVKGAYWDSEIKRAQERGLEGYPVFTRKAATDVNYLACARFLLARRQRFYPMFATHNAHTAAAVLALAGDRRGFEFQRLHGMGEGLFAQLLGPEGVPCRVYAPVGRHEDLLAYLVRRLLENGANSSFVNRIQDHHVPIEEVIADPVARLEGLRAKPHPRIPLPADLFQPQRRNSAGIDLDNPLELEALRAGLERAWAGSWQAAPMVAGRAPAGQGRPVRNPANHRHEVGTVFEADAADLEAALAAADAAFAGWAATPARARAGALDRAAALLERDRPELMALLIREAGKTIPDALAELREAVDFCRYYAAQARAEFERPQTLPGPTGELNQLSLHGRGVFACISPWNFPLAIFLGQVAAALAAGNCVIAKPAEQTPLIAAAAVRRLYEAGLPEAVLQLLPGSGDGLGARLVADARIAGVAFTGSVEVARRINRALAARPGPIVPLIAETGGINAMVVDSSALPEQVVDDVLTSAFRSAGQRCSALRLLLLQADIADRVLALLAGAAAELRVGDPSRIETDVGPVIDESARARLLDHARAMAGEARLLFELPLDAECCCGSFVAPRAFELTHPDQLRQEVFGPILHVVRWERGRLDQMLAAVAAGGYGLTLGVHSRIERTQQAICRRLPVGNQYVNRSMIGAVVGVQPFGGQGLSGTGPKAGGPRSLHRFAVERTLSVNTTAGGGNTALVSLEEE
jgi:RHH-type proline utilization regulon transcriptional repressor/proline dehydrogenase/delta 1-pyrroline-5-carboxylate dehydrogenase